MGVDPGDLDQAVRLHASYPDPGVGGRCITIEPSYLSHSVRSLGYQFQFVELAQEISSRIPPYA